MTRTIRRTIVVEYESELDVEYERRNQQLDQAPLEVRLPHGYEWVANWPPDAEIRETVEEITEDAGKAPAGVSGRVDQ